MRLLSLISPFIFFSIFSCTSKEKTESTEEARDLFSKSAELIIHTTNQIKDAKDSLEIDSLTYVFEKRITEINFEYPPQTDFKLNEIENDSLYNLLTIMTKEKKSKLSQFSVILKDSIE